MSTCNVDPATPGIVITPSPSCGPLAPIQEDEVADIVVNLAKAVKLSDTASDENFVTIINFHVDSDTSIKVEGPHGALKFQVSSCTLATSSPVWRKLLYGQDTIGRPSKGEWILPVNDDPKALEAIFRIVHFDFAKVPKQPTLNELYEIAILTARYQCTHLVYPWANKWVSPLQSFASEEDCAISAHQAAWVAWEFGDAKLFKDMTDSLVVTAKLDEKGNLVNEAGIQLKDLVLPPGLLERINIARSATIAAILPHIKEAIDHLSGISHVDGLKFCKISMNSEQCEAMMFGCALQALIPKHLYPVPVATKYEGSIKDLQDCVNNIQFMDYQGKGYAPHLSHKSCNLRFEEKVREVTKKMPVALSGTHTTHIAEQALAAGIDNGTHLDPIPSPLSPTAEEFDPVKVETEESAMVKAETEEETEDTNLSKAALEHKNNKGGEDCNANNVDTTTEVKKESADGSDNDVPVKAEDAGVDADAV